MIVICDVIFVFGRIALNIVYVHFKHFRLFWRHSWKSTTYANLLSWLGNQTIPWYSFRWSSDEGILFFWIFLSKYKRMVSMYMLVFVKLLFFVAGFMQFSMLRHQHWFMQCSSTSRQTNAERYQNISNELEMVSYNGSAGMHGHKMSRLTLLCR